MNKNKGLLKAILLLIGAIVIPIMLFYGVLLFELYIGFWRPDLTYDGDKTVLEEDVIHYEKIALRDLRLDQYRNYEGYTRHLKYYIVKSNHLSKKKIYQLLLNYCKEYYENNNSYDEIGFFFYEECGTMPWFWNDEGFFPDLEMNSGNLICRVFISKEGIKLIEGGW
ncbi:MAG: hypothetical protein K2H67_05235 [Treponemataceae bacterium]|nr:hypothetical protein [Treponemataceae bacterium]